MTDINKDDLVLLTADEIFDADDREFEIVPVPEWGANRAVRVQSLSAWERDRFETSFVQEKRGKRVQNLDNLRAKLAVLVIVDGTGKRLFNDKQATQLGNKSAAALQRIFNVAQKLNGLSDSDVEELAEDFDETPDESSTSD
jgi:hypothetical protein